MLGLLASKTEKAIHNQQLKEHLLITRYDPDRAERGEMMLYSDIQDILSINTLGVIPESKAVLKASNIGDPVIFDKESDAGIAYADTVTRILGNETPLKFIQPKRTLMQRLNRFSKAKEPA